MRVKTNRLLLLLILFLTSCSLFKSPEEKAMQLAVDTAVAYFTYDYEDAEGWMKPVQNEFYYKEFISDQVLPVLDPYFYQFFLKSTAALINVEEYARGISSIDNTPVIVWKIDLEVSPAWPAGGPPPPFGIDMDSIPWADKENTTVFAAAANRLGVWNIKLLTADSAEDIIATLDSSE